VPIGDLSKPEARLSFKDSIRPAKNLLGIPGKPKPILSRRIALILGKKKQKRPSLINIGADPGELIEQNMMQNALKEILKTSAENSRNDSNSPKNSNLRTPGMRTPIKPSPIDHPLLSITSSPAKVSGSRFVKVGFSDEETTIRTTGTKQG
jgi:hypothetical protein